MGAVRAQHSQNYFLLLISHVISTSLLFPMFMGNVAWCKVHRLNNFRNLVIVLWIMLYISYFYIFAWYHLLHNQKWINRYKLLAPRWVLQTDGTRKRLLQMLGKRLHLFEVAVLSLLPVHHVMEDWDHDIPDFWLRNKCNTKKGANHSRNKVNLMLTCTTQSNCN